jgi:hypothetical protein
MAGMEVQVQRLTQSVRPDRRTPVVLRMEFECLQWSACLARAGHLGGGSLVVGVIIDKVVSAVATCDEAGGPCRIEGMEFHGTLQDLEGRRGEQWRRFWSGIEEHGAISIPGQDKPSVHGRWPGVPCRRRP